MKYKLQISLLLLCLFVGCEKPYESRIPNVPVSLELDLHQSPYYKIDETPYFLEIKHRMSYRDRLGYGGLIVGYSVVSNDFCAYDLSCPIEADRDVCLQVREEKGWIAVCPKCGSEFNLSSWGVLVKGSEGAYLKRYRAQKTKVHFLQVFN